METISMRTFMVWVLALLAYTPATFAEDNSTCVEEEEYPPGGGGGYPPPGKDGKQPPKQGWPNPGCSGKWKSKWTTWTSTTSTYTSTSSTSLSSSSTSSSSSSASATPTTPAVTFRNSVFYQNLNTLYSPLQLPVNDLTNVFYAFTNILPDGTVASSNPFVDLQFQFGTKNDRRNKLAARNEKRQTGMNAYGAVQQLFRFKTQQRNLKVILAVGGTVPGASANFSAAASTPVTRANFANTAVQLVTDWGMDGIGIDWAFPSTATDAANLLSLVAATRAAFDNYSLVNGLNYTFFISVPLQSNSSIYQYLDLPTLAPLVDNWNFLAFNYSGNFSLNATHDANVYPETNVTALDTDSALNYYLTSGIPSSNISLGIPLFGKSFENTAGLAQPFNGVGPGGPQPLGNGSVPGEWLYNSLPRAGASTFYDDTAQASYTYDPSTLELISYDNQQAGAFKAQYAVSRALGGTIFLEARGDQPAYSNGSLIGTVRNGLVNLATTINNLNYPTSQYDNIRTGNP